jgi:hypothetical protein
VDGPRTQAQQILPRSLLLHPLSVLLPCSLANVFETFKGGVALILKRIGMKPEGGRNPD